MITLRCMCRNLIFLIVFISTTASSQSLENLIIRGDYTLSDSLQVVDAYKNSFKAVDLMYKEAIVIAEAVSSQSESKNAKKEMWMEKEPFSFWLGKPERIDIAVRRISKIRKRYDKKFVLEITKEDKGRCKGWISAWAIPYGNTRIVLCDKYFKYRTHLHEKIIVHELGHEVGMLSHHRIHGCWAAQRAAATPESNVAKRSPENYAWLAMSYLGLPCGY